MKSDLFLLERGGDQYKTTRGDIAVRGLSGFCSGKPENSEVVTGAVSPYGFTFAGGTARALVSATASTVFSVKKNGTSIGTITFGAGATLGSVSIVGSVVAGDYITITAPASADSTLADITFLLNE